MGCPAKSLRSLDIRGEGLAEEKLLQKFESTGAYRNRKERNDTVNEYLQLLFNGLFTGLGSALGAYLATRLFIKHIEMLEKRIKNNEEAKTE